MRKKIAFVRLFDNCCYGSYNPGILFEVFRWMIKTGEVYEKKTIFGWLWGRSREQGFSGEQQWDAQIEKIFLRAIISEDCPKSVKLWREKERILIGKYRMIEFPEGHSIMQSSSPYRLDEISALFKFQGRKLSKSLNEYHPQAIDIEQVLLETNGEEWQISIQYGYDGSYWCKTISYQGQRAFGDFIVDSIAVLEKLTGVDNKK